MAYKYRIRVIESERGWGQDHWNEDFNTPEEAEARIKEINSRNTSPTAPDWYMRAFDEITLIEV